MEKRGESPGTPCRAATATTTPSGPRRRATRSPDSIRLGPASARVQSFSARFTRPYPKGAQVACVTCTPLRFAGRVRCTCSARAIGASASPLSPSPLLLRRRVFLLLFLLLCCVFNYIPPASINFLGQLRSDRRALARSRRGFAGAEQSRIVCRKNKKNRGQRASASPLSLYGLYWSEAEAAVKRNDSMSS